MVALAQHYKKQHASLQENEDCVPAICNEWFIFKISGTVNKLKEFWRFSVPSNELFAGLWQLSIFCAHPSLLHIVREELDS